MTPPLGIPKTSSRLTPAEQRFLLMLAEAIHAWQRRQRSRKRGLKRLADIMQVPVATVFRLHHPLRQGPPRLRTVVRALSAMGLTLTIASKADIPQVSCAR